MVNYNNDLRYRIIDTKMYPHNAIGRMIVRFYSQADKYGGTGFLTDDYVFVTAAHNVRDSDGIKKAEEIAIYFGLDGDVNQHEVKPIQLHGRDFSVPQSYSKPTDFCVSLNAIPCQLMGELYFYVCNMYAYIIRFIALEFS